MKPAHATTLRIAAVLAAVFASSVLINVVFGVFAPADVRTWLDGLRDRPGVLFAALVVILAVDSFLAVPTVTTVVLAGYFLGPWLGGAGSTLGILAAGSICFWGARFFGLGRFASSRAVGRVRSTVGDVGPIPLVLSRALPILPEVLSSLAGVGGMRPSRYYLYFALGNAPFAFLAAWAGSVSSFERPWPALVVGIGVPALAAGLLARYRRRRSSPSEARRSIEPVANPISW